MERKWQKLLLILLEEIDTRSILLGINIRDRSIDEVSYEDLTKVMKSCQWEHGLHPSGYRAVT